MDRAYVWVWHEKPTTAAQPPPATKFQRQPDFTPRAVGAWAQRLEEAECSAKLTSRISVQATPALRPYLCHGDRDSGHDCGTKQPAKEEETKEEQHLQVPAVGMDDNSQPAVGQKQAAKMVQYLDYFCFDESVRQL